MKYLYAAILTMLLTGCATNKSETHDFDQLTADQKMLALQISLSCIWEPEKCKKYKVKPIK